MDFRQPNRSERARRRGVAGRGRVLRIPQAASAPCWAPQRGVCNQAHTGIRGMVGKNQRIDALDPLALTSLH